MPLVPQRGAARAKVAPDDALAEGSCSLTCLLSEGNILMRITKRRLLLDASGIAVLATVFASAVTLQLHAGSAHASPISFQTVPLTRVGGGSLTAGAMATDTSTQADEFDTALLSGDADSAIGGVDEGGINRTLPGAKTGNGK